MRRPLVILGIGCVLNAVAYFALPHVLDIVLPPQRPSAVPNAPVSVTLPACDIIAFRRSTCT